jgi:hypothetical protein
VTCIHIWAYLQKPSKALIIPGMKATRSHVLRSGLKNILSRDRVTTDGVFDWRSDLLHAYTTRDYTSQITITHKAVFSVTLLPTSDVPLLPGNVLAGWRPFHANLIPSLQTLNWIESKQAVAYRWNLPAWLFLVSSPIGTQDHIFVLIYVYNPYGIRRWASSSVRGGVGLFNAVRHVIRC